MSKIVKMTKEEYDGDALRCILEELEVCYKAAARIMVAKPRMSTDSETMEESLRWAKEKLLNEETVSLGGFLEHSGFHVVDDYYGGLPWQRLRWKLTITRTTETEEIGP